MRDWGTWYCFTSYYKFANWGIDFLEKSLPFDFFFVYIFKTFRKFYLTFGFFNNYAQETDPWCWRTAHLHVIRNIL